EEAFPCLPLMGAEVAWLDGLPDAPCDDLRLSGLLVNGRWGDVEPDTPVHARGARLPVVEVGVAGQPGLAVVGDGVAGAVHERVVGAGVLPGLRSVGVSTCGRRGDLPRVL